MLPLQQVVYRQLMCLVTIQSVITALTGTRQRWQAISRTGVFAEPTALPRLAAPAGGEKERDGGQQAQAAEQAGHEVGGAQARGVRDEAG